MEKRKVYGNGFGQFLLILAFVVGLVGNIWLLFAMLDGFNGDKLMDAFKALETILCLVLVFVPAVLLLIGFVFSLVGAFGRRRGASLTAIVFMILAVLVQAAGFLSVVANYSRPLGFDNPENMGTTFSLIGNIAGAVLGVLALIGAICVMKKKKGGSLFFCIFALICGLGYAVLGSLSYLIASYSEISVFMHYFDDPAIDVLGQYMIIGRYVFVGLFALALFVFSLSKMKVKAEKVEEDDDDDDDDDHHDDDGKKEPAADVKVINDPFNDRIIIEIR